MKPERWCVYCVLDIWRTRGLGRERKEAPTEVEGMPWFSLGVIWEEMTVETWALVRLMVLPLQVGVKRDGNLRG